MGNKDAMRGFIGGLLITGLLLGGGGLALAATTNTGTNSMALVYGAKLQDIRGMNSDLWQSVLDELVANQTITQTQADQIISKEKHLQSESLNLKGQIDNMKEKLKNMTQDERKAYLEENKPERVDMFSQLVTDGTITQDQADAIKKAYQEKIADQREEQLKTALNGLVDTNVINNEQMTAILDKLSELQTDRQTQLNAVKDMNREQCQAYFENNKPTQVNPLADLVADGTITQDQADRIAEAIQWGGKETNSHQGHGRGGDYNMKIEKTL